MLDRQGVRRGECKVTDCECNSFTLYSKKISDQRCEYCDHLPTLHWNMEEANSPVESELISSSVANMSAAEITRVKKTVDRHLEKILLPFEEYASKDESVTFRANKGLSSESTYQYTRNIKQYAHWLILNGKFKLASNLTIGNMCELTLFKEFLK
jgi:hypothetical protein